MIFFFTWEENFLIEQQLIKWKKAFVTKYGANNYYAYPDIIDSADEIISACMGGWLFDEKKFIVIKWVPKDGLNKISSSDQEKLEKFFTEHIDNLSTDNVIAIVSYKPDKRTKFYKFLSKKSNIDLKEFKAFSEKKLIAYLMKTFQINESLAEYVIWKTWTNLFSIHNELEKILKVSSNITKELVDKYVNTNTEQDSFALLDNLNNKEKAIKILQNLQANQEDFFKILWLLYWNLKNIILIVENKKDGLTSKEIATKLWVHPFVVWKIYKYNNDFWVYKDMFKKLIDLDYAIKSWKIDSWLWYLYLKKIILDIKK